MFAKTIERLGLQGERGAGVVNVVLGVAIAATVGFFVISSLMNGLDRSGFSATQNTTYDTYSGNINTGWVLLGLLIIVLAAAAIMQAVG